MKKGNIKEDKGEERNVKKNPLSTGDVKTKESKPRPPAPRILTSSALSDQEGQDVALQVHGMKESKPAPEVPAPIVPEEKVIKVFVVNQPGGKNEK